MNYFIIISNNYQYIKIYTIYFNYTLNTFSYFSKALLNYAYLI